MWGLVPSFGVPLRALLRDALRDLQGFKVWEFLRVHLTGSFKASTRVSGLGDSHLCSSRPQVHNHAGT